MAIPKIIHSCWFGAGAKSAIAQRCMATWKEFCPDYEFKFWNEHNTAAYQNSFYKDAIRNKQYAFASDCIRVQALAEFGGIYLDADMLLVQPLDSLLTYNFFTGLEVEARPAYGIFGGIPGHRFFKIMAQFYASQRYNRYSPPVITHTFKEQINTTTLQEGERIFTPEWFYPFPYEQRNQDYKPFVGKSTIAVHLWDHSWKQSQEHTTGWLLKQLGNVAVDRFVHKYPKAYGKRYFKEFGRKLYHKITGKQ